MVGNTAPTAVLARIQRTVNAYAEITHCKSPTSTENSSPMVGNAMVIALRLARSRNTAEQLIWRYFIRSRSRFRESGVWSLMGETYTTANMKYGLRTLLLLVEMAARSWRSRLLAEERAMTKEGVWCVAGGSMKHNSRRRETENRERRPSLYTWKM